MYMRVYMYVSFIYNKYINMPFIRSAASFGWTTRDCWLLLKIFTLILDDFEILFESYLWCYLIMTDSTETANYCRVNY